MEQWQQQPGPGQDRPALPARQQPYGQAPGAWAPPPQPYPYQQRPVPPYPPQPGYAPAPWQYPPPPVSAYTRRGLGPFWTVFHLGMSVLTLGIWIPIWIWHSKSRNTRTTFR